MPDRRRVETGDTLSISKASLGALVDALAGLGFIPVGPKVRDAAIVYERLNSATDLPAGYSTEQAPGQFRLLRQPSDRVFDFVPGSASWKQFLFPPRTELFALRRNGSGWRPVEIRSSEATAYAFMGVRPCELAAIRILDRAFLRDDFSDPTYHGVRTKVFILAVNCTQPAGTCFCSTMKTGPKAESGFDLCLTELDEHFLVEIGSSLGRDVIQELPSEPASAFLLGSAQVALTSAAERAACRIQMDNCAGTMLSRLEHRHWDEVAARCLSCGNCSLVCPTCFCWEVVDRTNLTSTETRRERVWDSCFNPSYSYQAGGNTRPSIRSRYRQWLSHKFGGWKQQFGVVGCVGCGRCITWCPAGIDTRIEVQTILEGQP